MNLGELRTRTYVRLGRKGDTNLNDDILYALNTIQREVNLMLNLQELTVFDKTTVYLAASTTNYPLPTDFLKMLIVWNDDTYSRELQRITPTEYKNYLSDIDTTTGENHYYDILGSSSNVKQIYLFPLRASIETGDITEVGDGGTGYIEVTSAAHGLSNGNVVTITGCTDTVYNVVAATISSVTTNTFEVEATYTATDTGTWTRIHYVPLVYIQKLTDLSSDSPSNVLTTYYPDLLIEGATYIMYRDVIYRDQPEKIAFREKQYQKQVEIVKIAQRQPDKIPKVAPKRLIPTTKKMYTTQTFGA